MTAEDDVVRAVMAVCDPSTSNQQRMECTKALEEFRHSSPPDLVSSVGFALIGKNDETLCFIGWNIIEDVIKLKWNDVSVEFRLEMRTKIMEILQRGLAESMVDSLSKTIVAMMEHEWPQNWSELIPQLVQLSQISSVHCTAVFAVLRRLVENVVTLMTIQNPQRRRDMYTGITLYMADIFKMALDQLDQLPGTASDESGYRTITYILGWLVETCEWVPSVAISTHLNRMVDSLIRHLNTPEKNIYELASRSLAALAERKKETSEECIVVSAFFRTEIIETILQTVRLSGESSETNGAHYRYLKALCGLLTSLGSHLSKVWSEKIPPENYSTYLSALCQIFSHPSLHLKLEALESLVYLSNHAVLGKSDVFHGELEIVLRGMLSALEKTGYPSQKPVTHAVHYSNMDYDDDLEWSNDLKKLRERARVLLVFSLERHFPLLIEILDQFVFQEVANKYLALDPVRWEPMQIFSKVVVQGGFDRELFTEASRDAMMAMGDALVQLMRSISNWDLLSEILSVHSSLLPIYRYHACGLNNYMDLLQWCLLSSNCHTSLNRHVISLILRAVTLFPDFFKVNVKLVIDLYQSVNSKVSHMQLAQLLQVFASLSNIVEIEEMKIELLSTCISPVIEYFSKYQNYFDSVESFIIFNGFELAPCNNFDSEEREDIKRRKSLRCYLTAVEGVLQQVQENSPLGRVNGVIVQLLPVFFKLNKVVLELSSQRALSNMHPGYHSVSEMTRSERETIYCSVGESLEIQLGKLEEEKKDTAELSKHYVNQLSMQCVNMIALIASKFSEQLHSHLQSAEMLMSTVNVMNLMPAFRVRHWIRKTWKNLITSTPQERWSQLVPFVEALTGHMKERLDEMWKTVSAIDYDAEPTEAELFNEHMTCVLAREYLTTIKMIYLGTDSGNQNEVVMTSLGHWLFTQQIGLSAVMYTVFTALTWRDTQSSTKAVPICKAFVDKLAERYDDETAVNMFYHSLNSLQIHGGDEVAGAPLLSLVAHIYVSLRRFSDSFPRVLLEVPGVTESDIAVLDQKVKAINCGEENLPEKKRREMLRKMLQSIISVSTSELHRRPVYLRPLPPIEKRRKEETSPDYEAVSVLFSNFLSIHYRLYKEYISVNLQTHVPVMRTLCRYCLLALGVAAYFWLLFYDFGRNAVEELKSEESLWTESGETDRLIRNYANLPCTFQSCFNFSLCLTDQPKVYVYPSQQGQFVSTTYSKILSSIKESAYFTDKPFEACLFVLSVDTVDRDRISENYVRDVNALIESLPSEVWNGGLNHVIFNLYHGTFPDYADHNLGFNTGKAIIARASPSVQHFRFGFDLSFPLFHKEHHLRTGPEKFLDLSQHDRHLLSFKGKRYVYGIGSETRDALHHLHNGESVAMVTTCKHNTDWEQHQDDRCQRDNLEYDKWDYESAMANSTFCLTPRGRRLGSFRFLESLRVGCIPVVLSDDWILPFEESLDWSKAAVVIAEENVLLTSELLRDIPERQVIRMKEQGHFLYNKYFRDVESITLSTIRIILDRARRSEGYRVRDWNSLSVPEIINGPTALVVLSKAVDLAEHWATSPKPEKIDELLILWLHEDLFPVKTEKHVKFVKTDMLDKLFKMTTATSFVFIDERMILGTEDIPHLLRYLKLYPERLIGVHGIDFDPTLQTVNFARLYNVVYPSLMAVHRESLINLSETFPSLLIRECFSEALNLAASDSSLQPPIVIGTRPVLPHMQNSKSADCWKRIAGRWSNGLPLHYSDFHYN